MSEQQQEAADGMGSEAHAATMDMDLGTVNSVEVYQFAKSCDMSAHNINMDLPIKETGHEIYITHPATMGMFNVDLDSPEKDSALMAAMQTRIDGRQNTEFPHRADYMQQAFLLGGTASKKMDVGLGKDMFGEIDKPILTPMTSSNRDLMDMISQIANGSSSKSNNLTATDLGVVQWMCFTGLYDKEKSKQEQQP